MQYKRLRLLPAVAVLCLGRGLWGFGADIESVRGEVHVDSPGILDGVVSLTDVQFHHSVDSVSIKGDGTFEFHHIPSGEYVLTVLANGNESIYEEVVSLRNGSQPLVVQAPHREIARPPEGPVSMAHLLHPPSKKAFQAMVAAQKFSEAGDHQRAADELEKAVELSPLCADIWTNLGAQHLRLGQYQRGLEELTRAAEMGNPSATILGNIAWALQALHRYEDAMRTARAALQIDSSCAAAHLILGSILTGNRATLAEAAAHLEIAARSIPSAQANLDAVRREMAQTVSRP